MGRVEGREGFPEDPEQIRKQKTQQIVDSILTNGLLSAKELRNSGAHPLRSADMNDPFWICGRWVIPKNHTVREESNAVGYIHRYVEIGGATRQIVGKVDPEDDDISLHTIRTSLYGKSQGYWSRTAILPVIAERQHEHSYHTENHLPKKELEARFAHSLVIAIPMKNLRNEEGLSKYPGTLGEEVVLGGPVLPHKFHAIIAPEQIAKDLSPIINRNEVSTRTASNVQREIGSRTFTVPDYEEEVLKILEEEKTPLFLHGVRLPTREDIEVINGTKGRPHCFTDCRDSY